MEFGIFLNGLHPRPGRPRHRACEHLRAQREAEYVIFADKHNWKYAWFGEHHGLVEYCHCRPPRSSWATSPPRPTTSTSAPAINSLSPRKEHPVRYAERAAMLDHFTNNRFEWGTGRGAGSHEMTVLQHHGQELDQGRVGTRSSARSRACGSRSTTSSTASTSPCPRRTTSSRSPTARATRRSGSRAATRRRSTRPASSASAPSPSTSSRSSTSAAASRPTRRASPTAPSPSVSSRTTT